MVPEQSVHNWEASNLIALILFFFFSVADVFLGYWIILVSKCLLPLQMVLELYQFFFCVCVALNSSNSVLYCFVCSLWLFVAQNYVYSRHIIESVKYYLISRKHDIFLSKIVAIEAPTHSLGL